MILPDANLLIYAVNRADPMHTKARIWLESALSGSRTVGFSWTVLLAVLRLTTRRGLFQKPMSPENALDLIESWLAAGPAIVVHPGPRHLTILREILPPWGTGGNLTSDAHLAALAIEHGAELCSADADFGRFQRLQWKNPLL